MKRKSVILLLLFAFIFVMAGSYENSRYENSASRMRGTAQGTSLQDTFLRPLIPAQFLLSDTSILQPHLGFIDSLNIDSLASLATVWPDTIGMDSLELAIWKHNKAIEDSLQADSVNRQRKNGIDSPVTFSAEDSLIYEAGTGMAFLYGSSNVKYQNMDLQSEQISLNLDSSMVHATGARDTSELSGMKGLPVFKMGNDTYESDTMAFNFKTKKGLIQQVYTEQEEGFMIELYNADKFVPPLEFLNEK